MRRPALYSLLLHAVILVILSVGFYNPFRRSLSEQKPLMVEFVQISDVSQAPVLAPQDVQEPDVEPAEQMPEAPEAKPSPPVKEVPPAKQENTPPVPEEQKPEPIPPLKPKVEEKKEEKKPQPEKEKPVEKKKEKTPPAKEKVELNLEKKKPTPKTDKKEDKKKLDSLLNDILDEVTKEEKNPAASQKKGGKVKGAPADRVGEVVTGTEIDAIRRNFMKCWIVPNGARDVQDLSVEIEMKISSDGMVTEAKVVDKARMARDPRFRAAAESAIRAVMDPRCSKLPLAPERYKEFKDGIVLNFDPKDMY